VCLCCAIISFDQVRVIDLVAVLLTGLAVLATLSRAGAVLLAFLLVCYCYRAVQTSHVKLSRLVVRLVGIGSMVAVAVMAGVVVVRQAAVFQLPSSRLYMLFGRAPVLPSNDPRVALLAESWRLISEAPFLGHGGGYANRIVPAVWEGPHNVYLQQWINSGLGGLVCFVWLLVASASVFFRRRCYSGLVLTGLAAIQGFFSHTLLDERAFLFLLGVLLTTSYFALPSAARVRRVPAAGSSVATAPPAARPQAVAFDGLASRSGSPGRRSTRWSP
jgi:O-antigen ligase